MDFFGTLGHLCCLFLSAFLYLKTTSFNSGHSNKASPVPSVIPDCICFGYCISCSIFGNRVNFIATLDDANARETLEMNIWVKYDASINETVSNKIDECGTRVNLIAQVIANLLQWKYNYYVIVGYKISSGTCDLGKFSTRNASGVQVHITTASYRIYIVLQTTWTRSTFIRDCWFAHLVDTKLSNNANFLRCYWLTNLAKLTSHFRNCNIAQDTESITTRLPVKTTGIVVEDVRVNE